jgi:hyperosmotically inducible protein
MRTFSNPAPIATRTLLAMAAGVALSVGGPPAMASAQEPSAYSDSVAATNADAAITAKVKAAFIADSPALSQNISITTTHGVVTLSGAVANSASRDRAAELALSIEGVKHVDNDLTSGTSPSSAKRVVMHAGKTMSDAWITTKVKSTILADSVSKGFEVSVDTRHGVVSLSGQLATFDAVEHVKILAEQVEGVKSVDTSGLTVANGT